MPQPARNAANGTPVSSGDEDATANGRSREQLPEVSSEPSIETLDQILDSTILQTSDEPVTANGRQLAETPSEPSIEALDQILDSTILQTSDESVTANGRQLAETPSESSSEPSIEAFDQLLDSLRALHTQLLREGIALILERLQGLGPEQPELERLRLELELERLRLELELERERLRQLASVQTVNQSLFSPGFFPPSADHGSSVPLATPKQTKNETRLQSLMSRLKDHLPQEEIDKVEAEVQGLRCIISTDLPDTPVYLSDNPLQIYEQSQLKHWFTSQPTKLHPITRAVIVGNVSYSEATETGQAIQQLLSCLEERLEALSAGQRCAY